LDETVPAHDGVFVISIQGSLERFYLSEIKDVDDDGLLDVVYCVWAGSTDSAGVAKAVGFQRRRWYSVKPPVSLLCGAREEP
jgi:hypothetical protein